ncbi:hypothetical protein [Methanonatronarchaeum sp. AMET-Sl]|uniref:hypothetical protein n=1 Tax=Methanonatronarchaeum sp. AMET-Sl TaxID=3037654 RepID=UPI00244E0247|nr:hypothetical protein [Methanonatronarchaeum sp. AMET-Sl]WGI18093.1 hypothetical protein QEN48_03575 [Methanonatronarchaeum sp. AMET-Sl]
MKRILVLGLIVALISGVMVTGCIENNNDELTAEETYEKFLTAAVEGDQDTVEELLHPDMLEEVDEGDIDWWIASFSLNYDSVGEVNEVEIEDGIQEVMDLEGDELENEVNYWENQYQSFVDEYGMDGYAVVTFSLTTAEGEQELRMDAVFEDDGNWYIAI